MCRPSPTRWPHFPPPSRQPIPPRLPGALQFRRPGASPGQDSATRVREPRLPAPERYDGSPGECRSFLTQCQLIFNLQPLTFPTDVAWVAYIITRLTGRARKWGTAAWSADLSCLRTSERFMAEMHRVFDRSSTGLEAGRELIHRVSDAGNG